MWLLADGRKRTLSTWLGFSTAVLAVFAICAPASFATVKPFEVDAYRKTLGVPPAVAETYLETQATGSKADIAADLEGRLRDDFASIWFDPESGEYVVPVASETAGGAVGSEMAAAHLVENYRTRVVKHSWEELEAAQDELDATLGKFFEADLVYTSLDPRTNAAVLHVAADASGKDRAAVSQIAKGIGDEVELRPEAEARFQMDLDSCSAQPGAMNCSTPLRGGVEIAYTAHPSIEGGTCTAGFRALGANGNRYVITAGHCALKDPSHPDFNDLNSQWKAWDEQQLLKWNYWGEVHYLGQVEQLSFPAHDWMKINVTGTEWDTWNTPQGWPSLVAYWPKDRYQRPAINEEYPINWEARSIVGQGVCHSGIASATTCGQVVATNVTYDVGEDGQLGYNLARVKGGCYEGGDSGGPYFAANTAYGIHVGSEDAHAPCSTYAYYHEITEATTALGVSVAKRAPRVTINPIIFNGNPGWATLKGEVTVPGTTISNKTVEIKLFKWNTSKSSWEQTTNPPLKTTVSNNKYEIPNYSVGTGAWIAKAVFPSQEPFGEATSDEASEGHFEIMDGYRLVARHSGKCLDVREVSLDNGARLHQWECLNPAEHQNQVFTVAPEGNGYYRLIARHSGRCVDVISAGTGDGARLQQWGCSGAPQQSWLPKQVGTSAYNNFIAKHSGKCMEVMGALTANGTDVQQWGCGAGTQQQWEYQSVNAAPIPTFTTATVPGGEVLPGEYGFATAYGYVKAGAYGFGGQKVKVRYDKWNGSYWELRTTSEPTINGEGRFEYKYMGLNPGDWRIYVEFPAVANFAYSKSGYQNFHIGRGYRLIARHSKKCMSVANNQWGNGVGIVQRDCNAVPSSSDGQVFTLVPFENGNFFEILINAHSTPQLGACVDVAGASTANGALLHQWDCGNGSGANQLWQPAQINGEGWYAFLAKHSGKCADVEQESTANGMQVHQWDCTWHGNQQWQKQLFG